MVEGCAVDPNREIFTPLAGHAAEKGEQQLIIALERRPTGAPGLTTMHSRSTFGLSLITRVFSDDNGHCSRRRIRTARNETKPHRRTLYSGCCLAAIMAGLLSGCAVGPDFIRPAAPAVNGYTPEPLGSHTAAARTRGGESQRFVRNLDLPGQWWRLFHSKPLNELVEKALAANPDLQAAQAALRVAWHNVRAQQGSLFPSIAASFNGSRGVSPNQGPPAPTADGPTFNLFTGQLNVSYTPDVFGGTRRSIEALVAQADQERFRLEATYLTLTSNLVGAAVQEAALREQIAATQRIIKLETEVLGALRSQREFGVVTEGDVVAQEAALAQAEQSLQPLRKHLDQTRDLLAALTGGFPSDRLPQRFEFSALHLPRDLPVSLPSRLVKQRPDIRAAEANLHAASAQIGVATANRLPNITLNANTGSTALSVDKLFSPHTAFGALSGSVTQTVFGAGTLLQHELAAKATFDQAEAQYRGTVVTAFQNVADALRAIQADAVALEKATASESAAGRSLELTRKRLELGDVGFLSLLNAQQTYQQAVISLAQTKAQRYADTVALFQALGGGWWNRRDPEPERAVKIGDFFRRDRACTRTRALTQCPPSRAS